MTPLRLTIIQTNIVWENKQENLRLLREKLDKLRGTTEIVVLPEMFSTGFSMNCAKLAEPITGTTIESIKEMAASFQVAIVGSFMCIENKIYYNRAFFITPEGKEHYYDKRHLFRMGEEAHYYTAGNTQTIVSYKGWNICLQVCYDLRFPVWSRNVNNAYDLLIYVANWPESRRTSWDTLLRARAIENLSYACGVNCTGTDEIGIVYNGGSAIISEKGDVIALANDGDEDCITAALDLDILKALREKFPAWKDADQFQIKL